MISLSKYAKKKMIAWLPARTRKPRRQGGAEGPLGAAKDWLTSIYVWMRRGNVCSKLKLSLFEG